MTRQILTTLAGLIWAGAACAGQANQVTCKWSELGPSVTGKQVSLALPDGTVLHGKVSGVEHTGLRLKISKTSDKKAQPKGEHTIPRQSVSFLQVTEYRKAGRLAFTLGTLAAASAVVAAASLNSDITEGPMVVAVPAVGAAATAGLTVGGYYIGKALDKRVTGIRIVPGI